jgi:transposase InsO family protein
MTQSGNPNDNAIAERVNGILKREFLDFETFETITQDKLFLSKQNI